MRRKFVMSAIGVAGCATGIVALVFARHEPGGSFAGTSTLGGIAELGAGWTLVLTGLTFWAQRPTNRFGLVLTAAGFAWFLPEWSNPGVTSSVAFTIGLVGFVGCPPLIAHSALAYPSGRMRNVFERTVVGLAYAGGIGLLGLMPTAVFDPGAQGCLQCPRNALLIDGNADAFGAFNRWGIRVGLAWAIAATALLAWRLIRSSPATLVVATPVLVAAGAFLVLVAWDFDHSLSRGLLSNDQFDVRLWRYEAAALAALALGVAWGLYRGRRARGSVAQLVVELGQSPRPGSVRDALAWALGDAELQLAYHRTETEAYVDAQGHPVDLSACRHGRVITPLLREGRPIAALVHDPNLLDDPGLIEDVVAATRLAVENERFEAEVRAQLESLRASRARIVEAGDTERRRLERDLHDGAQQRLVGLSLALRVARSQLGADPDPNTVARLDEAESELREALAELRELAHGIYPAVLADEGLGAAIETLAEQASIPIELDALTADRFGPAVEAAAYFFIAEAVKRTGGARAAVGAERRDGHLVVELRTDGALEEELTDLEDRIGALDGRLVVEHAPEGLKLRVEVPCG